MSELLNENKISSENPRLFIEMAKRAYERNDYVKVCECLESLIKIDSTKPEYFSGLATAQKKLKKFDDAEINYLNALKIKSS
ncbi:MAG: tetratricopeptide repeat protein, partial [Ignavibacteriaceae bacterium]